MVLHTDVVVKRKKKPRVGRMARPGAVREEAGRFNPPREVKYVVPSMPLMPDMPFWPDMPLMPDMPDMPF